MKQTFETKNREKYFTTSEISGKIHKDISYLRENLAIITEEYEEKLVEDLERFMVEDIAGEIRLSLYDPLQNNRVFMEYCYKVEPFSTYTSKEKWDTHVSILDLPETCLFDIFIYFTTRFAGLRPEFQKDLLKNYNIDWYDLNFNLKYSQKESRKTAGAMRGEEVSVNRYLYESPVKGDQDVDSRSANAINGDAHTAHSERNKENGSGHEKLDEFEEKLVEAIKGEKKINYVAYKDMESAAESIAYVVRQYHKVPIRWSLSRGFVISDKSDRNLTEGAGHIPDIKNPAAALNFIIDNREDRASYIFEDFHHHLGSASTINSAVAEIRSLVRDLSRNLRARDEYVFFLSPSENLPVELVPVFNLIKQETAGKDLSLLSRYGHDMTDPVLCGKSKPIVGKEDKIKRMIQVLCQMETNNPILVGGAGVGKTALVEGLASEIVKDRVPPILKGKTIFSLNMNTLVAGSRYRGEFEERISTVVEEVKSRDRNLIVFIDEIHTLLGAGSAEGASGAEDILKPALARGDFPCIGATTFDGYECILRDPALARRFQKLEVPAATVRESEDILNGIKHVFEKHHDVIINDDAIKEAVRLSEKYIQDQFLPGKAVRVLDSSSAFVKLEGRSAVSAKDIEEDMRRSRS